MAIVTFQQKGNLKKTERFLKRNCDMNLDQLLDEYGKLGVQALSDSTPVDTGATSQSWYYTIENNKNNIKLSFGNKNIVKGVPIAIILQYGHGTRNGGYVEGRDYINPAIQPIFDKLADSMWREVTEQ